MAIHIAARIKGLKMPLFSFKVPFSILCLFFTKGLKHRARACCWCNHSD